MLEDKINELNSIVLDENSPLYEFRSRINKYTNAILNGEVDILHFDELLSDFDIIKINLDSGELQNSELIEQIKLAIKDELLK